MSEPERSAGDIREDVVQRLLNGHHEHGSGAALADFIGVEFSKDPPTDAEREEAHRRYVDELAEKGMAALGEPEPEPEPEPEAVPPAEGENPQ